MSTEFLKVYDEPLLPGMTFGWIEYLNNLPYNPHTRRHLFPNIGEIRFSPWSSRDGWSLFESVEQLADGTPKIYVLLYEDHLVTAIIEIAEGEEAGDRALKAIRQAKIDYITQRNSTED